MLPTNIRHINQIFPRNQLFELVHYTASSFVESSFDVISCDIIVAVKIHISMKYTKRIYKVENPVSHRVCLSRIADNNSQRLIV